MLICDELATIETVKEKEWEIVQSHGKSCYRIENVEAKKEAWMEKFGNLRFVAKFGKSSMTKSSAMNWFNCWCTVGVVRKQNNKK